jgi:hypothetical protein
MCFGKYIELHEVPVHCMRFMLTDWIWDLIRGRCLRFIHFATKGCMQRASLFCEPSYSLHKSFNIVLFEKDQSKPVHKLMTIAY